MNKIKKLETMQKIIANKVIDKIKSKKTILLLFFLLVSCFPLHSKISNKLYYNQPKEDVKKKMGKPDFSQRYYSKEIYGYYLHESIYDLFINSKRFPWIGFYPFLRTGKEFYVIFDDDKVVSYGFKSNFSQTIPTLLKDDISKTSLFKLDE